MAENSLTKSVLVTGADGFIGSHLVELLLSQGFKVKALAQYNSFNLKAIRLYVDLNHYSTGQGHKLPPASNGDPYLPISHCNL